MNKKVSVKNAFIFCLPSPQCGRDSANFQVRIEFEMQTSAKAKGWFSKSREARGPCFGQPEDGLPKTVSRRNVYNLFRVYPALEIGASRRIPPTKQKSSSARVVFASRLPRTRQFASPRQKKYWTKTCPSSTPSFFVCRLHNVDGVPQTSKKGLNSKRKLPRKQKVDFRNQKKLGVPFSGALKAVCRKAFRGEMSIICFARYEFFLQNKNPPSRVLFLRLDFRETANLLASAN